MFPETGRISRACIKNSIVAEAFQSLLWKSRKWKLMQHCSPRKVCVVLAFVPISVLANIGGSNGLVLYPDHLRVESGHKTSNGWN